MRVVTSKAERTFERHKDVARMRNGVLHLHRTTSVLRRQGMSGTLKRVVLWNELHFEMSCALAGHVELARAPIPDVAPSGAQFPSV